MNRPFILTNTTQRKKGSYQLNLQKFGNVLVDQIFKYSVPGFIYLQCPIELYSTNSKLLGWGRCKK